MFVILEVVSFLANPGRSNLCSVVGSKLIKRIRSLCFEKVVKAVGLRVVLWWRWRR
ncbi:hypothetical protein Hanom_Chr11g01054531 [Helianthus anomalus]